jgi:ABC-2 type transport system permease protein
MTRERERGTMENLLATPVRPVEVMLGKILPYIVIGYIQLGVILGAAALLFQIPMVGSFWLLIAMIGVFIVANLGVGLLISTLTRTQMQAMQLGFFFLLPNILLSGFMFPRAAMPAPAQWIGLALPLTYYLTVLRGILLKGIGLEQLWRETLILAAFAVALLALSVRRFRKTIE